MRIDELRIQNYRVLKDITFDKITPFTVLTGANGSGKSTIFDIFAFLNEAFTDGLRAAWDRRNRIESIRSRGSSGPVTFTIKYRAENDEGVSRRVTYSLSVDQEGNMPVVVEERLMWSTAPGSGRPRNILLFKHGRGSVYDEVTGETRERTLASPDLLAVSALGQFEEHPRVLALREFVTGWHLSYVSADGTRQSPQAGPEPHLSKSGDNLANVIQFLQEEHSDVLGGIFDTLSRRVPHLESVLPTPLDDGRLLLRLKDRTFDEPVLARYASDGTLKLLAYLTVIHDPEPFAVVGIEEPENQLHPKLLPLLAEELRGLSARSQVFVTTHSPEFLSGLRPEELWAVQRDSDGFARVERASASPLVAAMIAQGAQLGDLWSEGFFRAADPAGL